MVSLRRRFESQYLSLKRLFTYKESTTMFRLQILLLYTHNEPEVLCNSTHTCNPSHKGVQRQEGCWGLPADSLDEK